VYFSFEGKNAAEVKAKFIIEGANVHPSDPEADEVIMQGRHNLLSSNII
jgi:glutamate dehydrogenase/leucine dehydrogenase